MTGNFIELTSIISEYFESNCLCLIDRHDFDKIVSGKGYPYYSYSKYSHFSDFFE